MMRRSVIYLILLISFSTTVARSQETSAPVPGLLENLFNRLIDNYNDVDRLRINDSIRQITDSYVRSDSVFTHRFKNLRFMGQITSPDSIIKIITWNLVLENQPGKYFCYFIRKQEAGKENLIYRLIADYNEKPITVDTIYTQSDWYGALYYDLRPALIDDKKCWVLLGLDYGNPNISRKLIEVLSFTDENKIIFGSRWFLSDGKPKFRAVFEYASGAMMSLRFRSDSSIVFDHLVPFSPELKDDRKYYGPDFSFDAYNYRDGVWKLIINVDARNEE